ncbi:hypothetical protein PHYPSEUDO_002741 [Phytophthora pseudosyringae]|uniref:Membrane-associated protein n=1 Tax=Phytophthora pseudosyringae TaxID=221518 RepID=A0A8T1VXL6_9STRA|nr:hypothetical protein PHYPSEUDO_002741 [Phytophthora pseudosyringae]
MGMMNLGQLYILVAFSLQVVPQVTGLKTSVAVYKDYRCQSPAQYVTLTTALTCTPQANHYDPICVEAAAGYTVSDCTDYNRGGWDNVGVVSSAFDEESYLGVEQYTPGRCGRYDFLTSATMYRLDENCYPNAAGTASHKLTLSHSATITTYSDATCTNVESATTVRQSTMGASRVSFCVDEMTAFFGGVRPNFTAVAVYNDNACSNTPTQIKFSQDFKCMNPADTSCQSGGSSQFSIPSCVSDFMDYSASLFGANSPYVIVQDFPNQWCYEVEFVTVYSADGSCHTSADGTTSFRAFINMVDSTATITLYSDPACNFVASDTTLDSQTLSSSPCFSYGCEYWFSCGRRYAVGGLGGPPSQGMKTAVVVYEDSYCAISPIQLTITMAMQCIPPPAPLCDTMFAGSNAVYQTRDCIGNVSTFVAAKFRATPYLIVENYAIGTNCQVLNNMTMYVADGKCHLNASDGSYFTIIQDMEGTVAVASYSTPSCQESEAFNFVVDSWYVNTDRCFGDRVFRTSDMALPTAISAPVTPTTTPTTTPRTPLPPKTWTPAPVTEIPVDDDAEARLTIMFPAWLWDPTPPRVFVDDGRRHHKTPGHRRFS